MATYIYIAYTLLFAAAFVLGIANLVINPKVIAVPKWWAYRYYIGGTMVVVALLLQAVYYLDLAYIQHFNTPILQQ